MPRPKRIINISIIEKMAEEYINENSSLGLLSRKYGYTIPRITEVFKENRIGIRTKPIVLNNEIIDRYRAGESVASLGRSLGISNPTLTKFLKKNDIKIRSIKEDAQNRLGSNAIGWSGYEEISGSYWTRIKKSAKARDISFDISIEEAWALFLKQGRRCALSGEALKFPIYTSDYHNSNFDISLDRVDSSVGYFIENVQWVLKAVNISKWSLSQEKYIYYCKMVSDYDGQNR
jgi:hypothetical protein